MGLPRKVTGLISMFMSLAMSIENNEYIDDKLEQYNQLTQKEKEDLYKQINIEREKRRIKYLKEKGVQEWIYFKKDETGNEISVIIYARNKKNADRKAKNAGCLVI